MQTAEIVVKFTHKSTEFVPVWQCAMTSKQAETKKGDSKKLTKKECVDALFGWCDRLDAE